MDCPRPSSGGVSTTMYNVISYMRLLFVSLFRVTQTLGRKLFTNSLVTPPPSWSCWFYFCVQFMKHFAAMHAHDIAALRSATDFPFMPGHRTLLPIVYGKSGGIIFENTHIRDVPCEVIRSASSPAKVVCLYMHGGGFALCSPASHRMVTVGISSSAHCTVVVPKYRRIPEHSIVDAIEDCLNVYLGILDQSERFGNQVCLVGDSAGGALSIMLMSEILEVKNRFPDRFGSLALPDRIALLSPWCDILDTGCGDLVEATAGEEETITAEMNVVSLQGHHDYLGLEVLTNMKLLIQKSLVSSEKTIDPMRIDSTCFPPMLIQAGSHEYLFGEICAFANKCSSTSKVYFRVYEEMVHIPHFFSLFQSEGNRAMSELVKFISGDTDQFDHLGDSHHTNQRPIALVDQTNR